jgi:hypothetical protein
MLFPTALETDFKKLVCQPCAHAAGGRLHVATLAGRLFYLLPSLNLVEKTANKYIKIAIGAVSDHIMNWEPAPQAIADASSRIRFRS